MKKRKVFRFFERLFSISVIGLIIAGCGEVEVSMTPPPIMGTETSIPLIATETITPTLLPTVGGVHTAGTYRLDATPWPEEGSLRTELEWDIDVVMRVDELPAGDYGIFGDKDFGLTYVSLEDVSQHGVLAHLPKEGFGAMMDSLGRIWGVGLDTEEYLYLTDFSQEDAFKIGPFCERGWTYYSPTKHWIAVNCKEWNGDEDELAVYEFIQSQNGKGYRIKLPFKLSRNFYWIDDNQFFISHIKIADGRMSCIVDLEKLEMECPEYLTGLEVNRLSLDRQYVILEKLQNRKREWFVAHVDCFQDELECALWTKIDEEIGYWGIPSWSPDNSMMLIHPDSFDGPWKFVIYGGTNWSEVITKIDNEGNDYYLFDWCPDNTCFFVEKRDISGITYIFWLDGIYIEMPYKNLVGVISVP